MPTEAPRDDAEHARRVAAMVAPGDEVLVWLRSLPDDLQKLRGLIDFIRALEHQREQALATRLLVIGALRAAGRSYDEIAAGSGLSKARVAQLARAAKEEVTYPPTDD